MRGKAQRAFHGIVTVGITPAYAGKSFQLGEVPAVQKDHPRLCGEKLFVIVCMVEQLGSPPPMRGKALLIVQKQYQ